jgi:hypothetical protein
VVRRYFAFVTDAEDAGEMEEILANLLKRIETVDSAHERFVTSKMRPRA